MLKQQSSFFIKTVLLKNKIITIFVKLLRSSRSLVEMKKVRWSTPLSPDLSPSPDLSTITLVVTLFSHYL